jgi:hypothetical protein
VQPVLVPFEPKADGLIRLANDAARFVPCRNFPAAKDAGHPWRRLDILGIAEISDGRDIGGEICER